MTPTIPVAYTLELLAEAEDTQARAAIVTKLGLSLRDLAEEVARRCMTLARQDLQAALRLAQRAVAVCDAELDSWAHARVLRVLASCLIAAHPADALAALERSEALFHEARDESAAVQSRIGQIGALNELGRQEEALARSAGIRHDLRALGLTGPLGKLYANEAAILLHLGRVREAARQLARARTLLRRAGEDLALAQVDGRRAVALEELGEVRTARRLYGRSLATYRAKGMRDAQARTMTDFGILATRLGSLAEALRLLLDALAIFRGEGDD